MTSKSRKPHAPLSSTVGYGKPPKEHQFRPGRSGNPRGRPNRRQSPDEFLDKLMRQQVKVKENGKSKKLTRLEALMYKLYARAMNGDQRATSTLLNLLKSHAADLQARARQLDLSLMTDEELDALVAAYKRIGKVQMQEEIDAIKRKFWNSDLD